MTSRDVRQILDAAEAAGCSIKRRRSGHWCVITPSGRSVTVPATPSDYRAIRNVLAELRRRGVDIGRRR